ncbi:iron-siderophore ABC transporter substrate-binding protein [Actinobacteria bacterium YIM 96077]|uniref:Iron-siderophore ABC transporter substrate-binding protein n=1 Tax=Phytoactinopolyspora halophila TaxID=1981511 RepID=A0A329R1X2_9ACTN|nr:iron-siderophore ABC transporter substrate-binding protein [Phytoactinopolyspora halophila]AYY12100.1 iron-siderophore ABC transporter substrate-binding protein [Actinobacteria bacterium YIM 96077]RAW18664.1 iron-siderophore ABC transporter substrate-binding protein [Phytoactinopolyspora halophila]
MISTNDVRGETTTKGPGVCSTIDHHPTPRHRARRYAGALLVAVAGLISSACAANDSDVASSESAGDPAEPAGSSDGSAAADAFPVTIESALGTAVIESEPERVVTIGWGADDIAVALDVVPVGIEEATFAGDDDGYRPWLREAVEASGADLPTTFSAQPELDIDAVVALEPDLILAPQSGITQDDYDVLSDLAPTVAYPERAWATPWDTQIELVGKALGKSDAADALIDQVTSRIADTAAEHPEFEGVTFAYIYAVERGSLHVYQRQDPRVEFVARLGLEEDPELSSLELSEGQFTTDLGLERADMLDDVDVVITWFNDEENQAEIEAQPLYAQIPAVQRGSYVVNHDHALIMAATLMTPLSVPWAVDEYAEDISDAIQHLE